MIQIEHLSKSFGDRLAVDDLSFDVLPGVVTGFLGPNGAGKTTTMRMVLGLDAPTSGRALVNGRPLRDHASPMKEIGALLNADAVHPRRSAHDHLRALAATTRIAEERVEAVLEVVGLADVADRPVGDFSLGMRQRLGIATALLGDPSVVMLDEPANGLDPDGIRWIRGFLRSLAAEGRTVLVSSHLMSEMSLTADRFIVIGRGRLIRDATAHELMALAEARVNVRVSDPGHLADALAARSVELRRRGSSLEVLGASSDAIGQLAHELGLVVHELSSEQNTLEEIFMTLTSDAVEYAAQDEAVPA